MRYLALVALGFALLVAQAALGVLMPLHEWAPNLMLPIVIYLGVTHDVQVARGAAASFVLGYLLDTFCGSPMGLQTFVMVASFLIARESGHRARRRSRTVFLARCTASGGTANSCSPRMSPKDEAASMSEGPPIPVISGVPPPPMANSCRYIEFNDSCCGFLNR